jgi:hypothetical protein
MHSDSAQCGTVYAAHRNKISNQTLQSTALAKPAPWVIDDMMQKKLRTPMQLISQDFQANMLMILVPAVVC